MQKAPTAFPANHAKLFGLLSSFIWRDADRP